MHLVSLCNHGVVPNAVCCSGTERARGMAQTLLNVPYGEGDGEKLDVYIPNINSLGTDMHRCPTHCYPPGIELV